jgi:hypothetical protein
MPVRGIYGDGRIGGASYSISNKIPIQRFTTNLHFIAKAHVIPYPSRYASLEARSVCVCSLSKDKTIPLKQIREIVQSANIVCPLCCRSSILFFAFHRKVLSLEIQL